KAMNWVYFWGHMPLVIIVAIWLWGWHRQTYTLTRNAFLASGAIGVVMYATLPLAPPRLIPFAGFVDTMAVYDRFGYNAQETKAFVNPYAAMPSLHFGWSLLLGYTAICVAPRNPFTVLFGITWPTAMFFAVILTGNHFILDAVVGGMVSFAGLGIAFAVRDVQPRAEAWARARLSGNPGGPSPRSPVP
ncbi:MAG: phosphatase PAP2 family protein, partial [Dehalococcoidia bacterium]